MTEENAAGAGNTPGGDETPPVGDVDFEALYRKEVENSKSQRHTKQEYSKELEEFRAAEKERKEAELVKNGEHETHIEQLRAERADLQAVNASLLEFKEGIDAKNTAKKDSLLELLSDEHKSIGESILDVDELEKFVKLHKTEEKITPKPPGYRPGTPTDGAKAGSKVELTNKFLSSNGAITREEYDRQMAALD